jgi:uncharacterized protein YecT (DUF1311 family)
MRNVSIYLFALILFAMHNKSLASDPLTLPSLRSCDAKLSNRETAECLDSVATKLDLILPRYVEAKRAGILRVTPAERRLEGDRADLFAIELEEAARSLERAQSSWVAYRDAHCDMVARLYLDGTGRAAGAAQCSIDLTIKRIRELWVGPR